MATPLGDDIKSLQGGSMVWDVDGWRGSEIGPGGADAHYLRLTALGVATEYAEALASNLFLFPVSGTQNPRAAGDHCMGHFGDLLLELALALAALRIGS